jgi:hypothetical protein
MDYVREGAEIYRRSFATIRAGCPPTCPGWWSG